MGEWHFQQGGEVEDALRVRTMEIVSLFLFSGKGKIIVGPIKTK